MLRQALADATRDDGSKAELDRLRTALAEAQKACEVGAAQAAAQAKEVEMLRAALADARVLAEQRQVAQTEGRKAADAARAEAARLAELYQKALDDGRTQLASAQIDSAGDAPSSDLVKPAEK